MTKWNSQSTPRVSTADIFPIRKLFRYVQLYFTKCMIKQKIMYAFLQRINAFISDLSINFKCLVLSKMVCVQNNKNDNGLINSRLRRR